VLSKKLVQIMNGFEGINVIRVTGLEANVTKEETVAEPMHLRRDGGGTSLIQFGECFPGVSQMQTSKDRKVGIGRDQSAAGATIGKTAQVNKHVEGRRGGSGNAEVRGMELG